VLCAVCVFAEEKRIIIGEIVERGTREPFGYNAIVSVLVYVLVISSIKGEREREKSSWEDRGENL
jgi:hypothetical protein